MTKWRLSDPSPVVKPSAIQNMPTISYSDTAEITAWGADHKLQLFTRYKDYEVRSVDIARKRQLVPSPTPFQIWVDIDEEGMVCVHAWDRDSQRFDLHVRPEAARVALEQALGWVRSRE